MGRKPRPAPTAPTARTVGTAGARPRLTGRAVILIVVVAVLAVSWASSMRAHLQQQEHMADLREQIDRTSAEIEVLKREKRRWQDDAFVEAQARQRFGYVMPGETSYMVIDEDGNPLDAPDELADPEARPAEVPPAWWDTAWSSVEAAGNPEKQAEKAPARKIGPEEEVE